MNDKCTSPNLNPIEWSSNWLFWSSNTAYFYKKRKEKRWSPTRLNLEETQQCILKYHYLGQ